MLFHNEEENYGNSTVPYLHNAKFIEEMKNHITTSLENFDEENIRNEQIRWELLKYAMRKFFKHFSKQISLESNKERP